MVAMNHALCLINLCMCAGWSRHGTTSKSFVLTPSSMVDPYYERLGSRRDPETELWSLEL